MTKRKTDEEISGLVEAEIRAATTYDDSELSSKRADAIDYFNGVMDDVPAQKNRSGFTDRTTSDTIGWMLPGIIRTFTASGRVVEYEPVGPEDEDGAQQASDYVHHIFMKDNAGYRILYNATHDSLLHGNGIVKVWWDDAEDIVQEELTGQSAEQLALLQQEGVEILTVDAREERIGGQTIETFDVKISRVKSRGRIAIDVVEPENFLIDADATEIGDARFTAQRSQKTRSQLIAMGFRRSAVEELPAGKGDWSEAEEARQPHETGTPAPTPESEIIDLFECYATIDVDGDGEAETVRITYAGDAGGGRLLDWEVCGDGQPFHDIPCMPVPHRWDSHSVFDDTRDIQQIKTVVTRQMLDNMYASNNPRPEVEQGSIVNAAALTQPKFGQPIYRKPGSAPLQWHDTPFVGDKALLVLRHADELAEKRTGVSRASMALDPDALQNQTATAVQEGRAAAYSKIELIARNQAELGWKGVFREILRLIHAHQDRKRTIRVNGRWVEMDPRAWNVDMDATVNIGLGTGSRDRDMAMLMQVSQSQQNLAENLLAVGQPAEAFGMLPKIVETLVKMGEAAGIRNARDYYPEFDERKVAGMLMQAAERAQRPSPDQQAAQAKLAAEIEAKKAAMQLKMAEAEQTLMLEREKLQLDAQMRRAQLAAEMDLKREQLAAELQLKRELEMERLAFQASMPGMDDGTSGVHLGGEPG